MAADEVLLVLIPEYADWEPALLAAGLRRGFGLWQPRYTVRIVGPTPEPVASLGGFRVQPDYTLASAPEEFAALILIGGTDWFGATAARVVPLAQRAVAAGAVLAGICDGSMFLGVHGFLNQVHHTSNRATEGPGRRRLYRRKPVPCGLPIGPRREDRHSQRRRLH